MTEPHEEEWVVVGARVSLLPDTKTAGSRVERCDQCGAQLWTSPSSDRHIARQRPRRVTYRCLTCVQEEGPAPVQNRVAPGAFHEAAEATGDRERIRRTIEALTGTRPSDD